MNDNENGSENPNEFNESGSGEQWQDYTSVTAAGHLKNDPDAFFRENGVTPPSESNKGSISLSKENFPAGDGEIYPGGQPQAQQIQYGQPGQQYDGDPYNYGSLPHMTGTPGGDRISQSGSYTPGPNDFAANNPPYGQPQNPQYSGQYNGQYGQQYNGQYPGQYNGQYGQQYNGQYSGQYSQPYSQPQYSHQQYGGQYPQTSGGQMYEGFSQQYRQQYGQDPYAGYTNNENNKLAVASMILGIVSLFTWLFGFIFIPLFLIPVIGIILGIVHKTKRLPTGKGMSTAGIVTSSIGFMLPIILIAVIIANMSSFMDLFKQSLDQVKVSDPATYQQIYDQYHDQYPEFFE